MANSSKKSNVKKKWIIIFILILCATAITVGVVLRGKQGTEEVSTRRETVTEAIYALGKVKSDLRYEVKVGVLTYLKTLNVREGQSVKKGHSLLQFEDSTLFKAPFDGTVTKINSYPGEIVVPQASVLRLENMDRRYIEVALEQQSTLRVKPGQKARVDFESIRSNQIEGKVATVFSRDDEFIAHIDVGDLPQGILPGMTADVVIEIGTKSDVLVVPITSVQDGQVLIIRDGKKMKLGLEIGVIDGEWAEVLSGDIRETDRIVVRRTGAGEL